MNDYSLQVLESVNKFLPYDNAGGHSLSKDNIIEAGYTEKYIQELIDMGILVATNKSNTLFPAYSITICKLVKYYVDLGVPLSVSKDIVNKLHEFAMQYGDIAKR